MLRSNLVFVNTVCACVCVCVCVWSSDVCTNLCAHYLTSLSCVSHSYGWVQKVSQYFLWRAVLECLLKLSQILFMTKIQSNVMLSRNFIWKVVQKLRLESDTKLEWSCRCLNQNLKCWHKYEVEWWKVFEWLEWWQIYVKPWFEEN